MAHLHHLLDRLESSASMKKTGFRKPTTIWYYLLPFFFFFPGSAPIINQWCMTFTLQGIVFFFMKCDTVVILLE